MNAFTPSVLSATLLIFKCRGTVAEVSRSLNVKILLLKSATLSLRARHFCDTSQNNLSRLFLLKSSHIFTSATLATLLSYVSHIRKHKYIRITPEIRIYIKHIEKKCRKCRAPKFLPLDGSAA